MSDIITVFIENDGNVSFLYSPLTAGFNLGPSVTRRASEIEPDCATLRLFFHVLRAVFGECGVVAEWTRHWPCLWRANLSLIGGPILAQRWYNRYEAIAAEILWFNDNGVQR
jgi:hypothetical protein